MEKNQILSLQIDIILNLYIEISEKHYSESIYLKTQG